MEKQKIRDILYLVCVFLVSIAIPFDLFIKDSIVAALCNMLVKIMFIAYAYSYNIKNQVAKEENIKINKQSICLLPLFLLCFCNLYFLLFNIDKVSFEGSIGLLLIQIIISLLTAISEEFLFRYIIHNNINTSSKLKKIIISAAIFGGFHIVNFLSSFNPSDLVIIIYTFGLGLVLGFIYEYSSNIILPIAFHFLFNVINNDLYTYLYHEDWNLSFVINAIVVSLIGGIYILLIYFFKYKKSKLS